jgi:L-seryl-tRNA(Ser) seleniumtransferase
MPVMDPAADSALQDLLRKLPAVDHLLNQPAIASLQDDYPRSELVSAVRTILDQRRDALRAGQSAAIDVATLALEIRQRLYQRARPNLRTVINATGIVLHTGLGRAPLAPEAVAAIAEVAAGYCNLELNLETGRRGNRHEHLRDLLREVCGAEDALVVNNNAAATYLALNTLAAGREVVISRGQLVEIGGSYRLPDIIAAANCRMVEVGTTNRTRIGDYERALSDQTSVLLRVHPSNYRVQGFTESVPLAELVDLGRRHNLLVVDDLGSGLITKDLPWPAPTVAEAPPADATAEPAEPPREESPTSPDTWEEPSVRESIAAGADLTLFSGDKLLGGPQAGIIVGRADLITGLRKNPLARTFRPGKLTLAGLEATVRLYRDPANVVRHIPTYRLLARSLPELEQAAGELAQQIAVAVPEAEVFTEPDYSEAGGGSLPVRPFPTCVVIVRPATLLPEAVAEGLRRRDLPIICRVREGALVFDPRTLEPDDADQIPPALAEVIRELSGA